MISVIDLGIGNINSVTKVLDCLETEYKLVSKPSDLSAESKLIFPGVGNFGSASMKLEKSGLKDSLKMLIKAGIPFLGICLGMQLLAENGDEGGDHLGLGVIKANVKKMVIPSNLSLPHIGWNSIEIGSAKLFEGIPNGSDFYFLHSHAMDVTDEKVLACHTEYGSKIVAYIEKDNVFGAQFHPEKSQKFGIKFIENFINLC
jgi:glutamine amidotransferase